MKDYDQEYVLNEKAAFYNCNVCGDVQIRMTGEGEQPPEGGCYNPECPSNKGKVPVSGFKIVYTEYKKIIIDRSKIDELFSHIRAIPGCPGPAESHIQKCNNHKDHCTECWKDYLLED